jgi:hypothetical protein
MATQDNIEEWQNLEIQRDRYYVDKKDKKVETF